MGKRKRRQRAVLPLFDLPLQSKGDESVAVEDMNLEEKTPSMEAPRPAEAAPSAGEVPAAETTTPAEAQLDPVEAQLDLVELAGSAEVDGAEVDGEEVETAEPEAETEDPDDRALLGDRLLGGLADVAAHLVATGLALAAVHAMGVVVSWADWMPFGILALVFSFVYCMVPLAFWGHTPGMAWVGHSARAADGEPLTFSQTFRRWLGALFTLAFAGLPLLLALTGRSFSDRISDSYTVAEP